MCVNRVQEESGKLWQRPVGSQSLGIWYECNYWWYSLLKFGSWGWLKPMRIICKHSCWIFCIRWILVEQINGAVAVLLGSDASVCSGPCSRNLRHYKLEVERGERYQQACLPVNKRVKLHHFFFPLFISTWMSIPVYHLCYLNYHVSYFCSAKCLVPKINPYWH